jgi:Zn-dependent protease with chaperone function
MRRLASALLILCLLLGSMPQPAWSMSDQKEIELGKMLDDEVDSQSVISTDPFLTNWVESIGAKLATHRARTAITYHFEIIDSNEVNSFAMPGGYVHVDMGLLNFVSSDDQLAGVMGHEMGHIERGNVTSLNDKGNILSILIGVLSILNPIGYLLGGTAGDLVYEKFSRIDELEADQYGLLLMSEAGYDPRSDVDTFINLAQLEGNGADEDKYFADHPAPLDRVAHLLGYPELSGETADSITAAAIHDEAEGRYSYAENRFQQVLAKNPDEAIAHAQLTDLNGATTESAAGSGQREMAADAFETDASATESASSALVAADNVARDDLAASEDRARTGGQEIENFVNQLESLSDGAPNLGQPKKKGNNLSIAVDGLNHLTRDINGTIDLTSDVMGTAPGLIDDVRSTIKKMEEPLAAGPLTPKYEALLPWYPSMTVGLQQSADDLVDSVDRSRSAISTSQDSIKLAETFFGAMNKLDTTYGDISDKDMVGIKAAMDAANAAWDAAFQGASEASNEMYAAQARSLSTQVTLNDLESSPERYAAYQKALEFRFPGVDIPDYKAALASGVAPGEIGCAAWYAYETKKPLAGILAQEQSDGSTAVDMARHDRLFAESMEIAEGLLLEDYTETLPPLPKAGAGKTPAST